MENSLATRVSEMLWLDQDLKTFYEISIFWITQKVKKVTKVRKLDLLPITLTKDLVILFQMAIIKTLTSIW